MPIGRPSFVWSVSRIQAVQVRPRTKRSLVPVDLKDIYAEQGEYSVKFLVDSEISQKLTSCDVLMFDCDGHKMPIEFRRWGTKVNVSFKIDQSVPDGAAIIEITMGGNDMKIDARFRVWAVK